MVFSVSSDGRAGWPDVFRDCLAVGTVVKILWDWQAPIGISGLVLFGIMFASLFRVLRGLIAFVAFMLFLLSIAVARWQGALTLFGVFLAYVLVMKVFRLRYL